MIFWKCWEGGQKRNKSPAGPLRIGGGVGGIPDPVLAVTCQLSGVKRTYEPHTQVETSGSPTSPSSQGGAYAASGADNGRVQYRRCAHSCLEPSPRRSGRLLQRDGRLCVGWEVSEGGGQCEGPRGIVDAHSAWRDERAERAASEGESRLTECLHGE